jgi:hypothetical protein
MIIAYLRAEKDDYIKHLKPSTADKPRPAGARCLKNNTPGVLCRCVEGSAPHNFRSFPGDTLLISPDRLLDH